MKLFGIGYLMDALNIKTSDLANYIYVDRSLISRWRSNTRNLDPNADYFDKILEFFILKNNESNNNILEKTFSLDIPGEEDEIKSLLREFIINKETPSIYNKFIKINKDFTYITQTIVYDGDEAYKNAIINFLETAENEPPCKLTLFYYAENVQVILNDNFLHKKYISILQRLLNSGFTLDIISSYVSSLNLLMLFSKLLFHENCFIYEFSFNISVIKNSLHILESKLVLSGIHKATTMQNISANKNNYNILSTIFSDPVSISTYTHIVDNIKLNLSPLLFNADAKYIAKIENKLNMNYFYDYSTSLHHSIIFCNSSPYPLLMSENLFLEILDESMTNKREIAKIYNLFLKRKKVFLRELDKFDKYHFYSLQELRKFSTQDYIELEYKNLFLSTNFRLTKSQFKLFLKDIAELLLTNPRFHICLNDNSILHPISSSHYLYVSNELFLTCDLSSKSNFKASTNELFINSIKTIFEQLYIFSPKMMTDNSLVAYLLKNI